MAVQPPQVAPEAPHQFASWLGGLSRGHSELAEPVFKLHPAHDDYTASIYIGHGPDLIVMLDLAFAKAAAHQLANAIRRYEWHYRQSFCEAHEGLRLFGPAAKPSTEPRSCYSQLKNLHIGLAWRRHAIVLHATAQNNEAVWLFLGPARAVALLYDLERAIQESEEASDL